ncbi:hypothetical protein ACWCPT_32365 [Streptomyces sp. NPDC002308]
MSMWSAADVARDRVRRQAAGLDLTELARRVSEAAGRADETAQHAERGGPPLSAFGGDLERLADVWAAQHAEWRRVSDVVAASGQDTYVPESDVRGTAWERERVERRERRLAEHGAFVAQRRERVDEVRAEVWLPPAPSRLIRQVAEQAGLTPGQVVEQLAERVVVSNDGTVSVAPFAPAPFASAPYGAEAVMTPCARRPPCPPG